MQYVAYRRIFTDMDSDWFQRLENAIRASGKPLRAVSLEAGLAETYVFQMLRHKKQPSVDKFLAICAAVNVSPIEILTGVRRDREIDQIEAMFAQMPEKQRQAFLAMLESMG
jgi:DNA-binding phage protein